MRLALNSGNEDADPRVCRTLCCIFIGKGKGSSLSDRMELNMDGLRSYSKGIPYF